MRQQANMAAGATLSSISTKNGAPLLHKLCILSYLLVSTFVVKDDIMAEAASSKSKKKRVCLMASTLPWAFGPYHSQLHKLSLLLDKKGYDVLWMNRSANSALPIGMYRTWKEASRHIPKIIDPPKDFEIDHLTFVGRGPVKHGNNGHYNKMSFFASKLNDLSEQYNIDVYITLVDLGEIVPDVAFTKPVVGWVPMHSGPLLPSTQEYWAVKNYHAVASLSPSSTSAIQSAMQRILPQMDVQFVPHMFDRAELSSLADKGLSYLEHASTDVADVQIRKEKQTGTKKLTGWEEPFPHPHISNQGNHGHEKETFFVLLQGGNYDSFDRKSWDTSIQAYAKFYHKYFGEQAGPDDSSGLPAAHLYMHSIEYYTTDGDMNSGTEADAMVLPVGTLLQKRAYESHLPRHAYTLDTSQYEVEIVLALKKRANVCLHPSKVEGFGMNVIECQALGTPVITTNHTAMGDFTKFGVSVPYEQVQFFAEGMGLEFAMPNVEGIAQALGKMYEEHVLLTTGRPYGAAAPDQGAQEALAASRAALATETQAWIDDVFSPQRVASSFVALMSSAEREWQRREAELTVAKGQSQAFPANTPPFYKRIDNGAHPEIVDWDEPWTLFAPKEFRVLREDGLQYFTRAMIVEEQSPAVAMMVPVTYEQTGEEIPVMGEDAWPHPHLSIFIRTYFVTEMQKSVSRRESIIVHAIEHARALNAATVLPDGIAVITGQPLRFEET